MSGMRPAARGAVSVRGCEMALSGLRGPRARRGLLSFPSAGDGMVRRAALPFSVLPRSFFEERGRLSALHPDRLAQSGLIWWRFLFPRSAFPGTRRWPVPVQQALCGAVVMPPDRVPGPPECEVTSLARGRNPSSRFSSALQERSSVEKVQGIYA